MALFALILVLLISAVVVKVGTVALTMTGLDRRKAAFQALSAFSTTGWTTREAELLMSHDQRRRIIMILVVLGHAGFASVIATLMLSLGQRGMLEISAKLVILAAALVTFYLLARWGGFNHRLTAEIERRLRQTTDLRVTSFEEVLLLAEGYGVVEVYVTDQSNIAHKTLGQSQMRNRGMVVMAVDRAGVIIPAPQAETCLRPDDRLICYGKVKAIEGIANEKTAGIIEGSPLMNLQT
jgi:hypothetical protein